VFLRRPPAGPARVRGFRGAVAVRTFWDKTLSSRALAATHGVPASRLGRRLFPATTELRSPDAVALTFDDGPDTALDQFLDQLAAAGATATFFVAGEQAERAPDRLRQIVSGGHHVGVHCYRHIDHLRLSSGQVLEDMRRAREVIEEATNEPTRLFRPPFGRFSMTSWVEAGRQGWKRVLWTLDRDARDWEAGASPRSIADNVGWPDPGNIILMHDSDRYAHPGSWRNTLAALPVILERIHDRGLVARSIVEML
jgi:peptidoglycan/xylan/chitin deacetylase (PgdA/CDA1 family)